MDTEANNYKEWFISALKSTKVNENGKLDRSNLLRNCFECQNEVRRLLERNTPDKTDKYKEFRINATVILILGCSSVKSVPRIFNSKDLGALTKSLPTIHESDALFVIQGLKNSIYLRDILPWLPISSLSQFVFSFCNEANAASPVSVAICYEFLFSILNSLMYESDKYQYGLDQILLKITDFLDTINHKFDTSENTVKEGYYFLYICESLFCCVNFIALKSAQNFPSTYLGQKVKSLYCDISREYPVNFENTILTFIQKISEIISELLVMITSEVWDHWKTVKVPFSGYQFSLEDKINDNSVQTQISYTAYGILRLLPGNNKLDDSGPLQLNFYPKLETFLNDVAVNPDIDPYESFTNEQLLEIISLNEERREKLVNILLIRDNIFPLTECLKCAEAFGDMLTSTNIAKLIENLINTSLHGTSILLERWKEVIISIAKRTHLDDMKKILIHNLHNGTDNYLKTDNFSSNNTYVFNQLCDGGDNVKCLYVWLCLQDGEAVVRHSVHLALSVSGLTPLIAPMLKEIYFTCQARKVLEYGILTSCLLEALQDKLTDGMTRQFQKEFLNLVMNLLGNPTEADEKPIPLNVLEIMDCIVLPQLNINENDRNFAPLVVDVLKGIVSLYPESVIEPTPKCAALIICLCALYSNSSFLVRQSYLATLGQRSTLKDILTIICEVILEKKEDFSKVILLIKEYLSRSHLHLRCLLLMSPVVDLAEALEYLPMNNKIFCHILYGSTGLDYREAIPSCSRLEWILALSLHLPHCSYDEWTSSLHLTRRSLSESDEMQHVAPTLKIFQEVLSIICVATSSPEDPEEELSSRDCRVAIEHSFRAFSLAAVKFISKYLELSTKHKQFLILTNIFCWWCHMLRAFKCDSQLPSLFLSELCTLLQDIVMSEETKIDVALPAGPLTNCENEVKVEGDKDEISTTERMKRRIEWMRKVFHENVPPNSVASSAEAKLKSLYETLH